MLLLWSLYCLALQKYLISHKYREFLETNDSIGRVVGVDDKFQKEVNFYQFEFISDAKKSNSIEGNQVILHQHKIPVGNTYKNAFLKRFKNS